MAELSIVAMTEHNQLLREVVDKGRRDEKSPMLKLQEHLATDAVKAQLQPLACSLILGSNGLRNMDMAGLLSRLADGFK